MRTSLIVAVAVSIGLGASSVLALTSSARAEDKVLEGKETMKGTGTSMTEATGKLKADANKTKDSAKALDLEKTKDSSKGMMTNPLGK